MRESSQWSESRAMPMKKPITVARTIAITVTSMVLATPTQNSPRMLSAWV